jgi:hypothetical protein
LEGPDLVDPGGVVGQHDRHRARKVDPHGLARCEDLVAPLDRPVRASLKQEIGQLERKLDPDASREQALDGSEPED